MVTGPPRPSRGEPAIPRVGSVPSSAHHGVPGVIGSAGAVKPTPLSKQPEPIGAPGADGEIALLVRNGRADEAIDGMPSHRRSARSQSVGVAPVMRLPDGGNLPPYGPAVEPGAFLVRFFRGRQGCVIRYLCPRPMSEASVVHSCLDHEFEYGARRDGEEARDDLVAQGRGTARSAVQHSADAPARLGDEAGAVCATGAVSRW